MRVGELIEELQRFDPMQTVYIPDRCVDNAFAKVSRVRVLFINGGSLATHGRGDFPLASNRIGLTAGKG